MDDVFTRFKGLGRGDKAECGCEVHDIPWTREYARGEFYKALAAMLEITETDSLKIGEHVELRSLPLDTEGLRRLWGKFWVACDVDVKFTEGEEKVVHLVDDKKLPRVSQTIREFIEDLARYHIGFAYSACIDHWDV